MAYQKVDTPFGQGTDEGRMVLFDGAGAVIGVRKLVRMKITDETVKHLADSNCLTPRATLHGLWTFDLSEVRHV